MAITYPLSWPSGKEASSSAWGLSSSVGVLESDFTFQTQTQEHQGEQWRISMQFPRMTGVDAGPYRAFFAMLRGQKGTFLMGDFTRKLPIGVVSGTVLVKGAGQSGNSLTIDGMPINTNGVFVAGDWIQLGSGGSSELYMVCADANTNASGETTLTIVPELQSTPADNAAVTYQNCKAVFRLTKNDVPCFQTSGPDHSVFSLDAVQVRE